MALRRICEFLLALDAVVVGAAGTPPAEEAPPAADVPIPAEPPSE